MMGNEGNVSYNLLISFSLCLVSGFLTHWTLKSPRVLIQISTTVLDALVLIFQLRLKDCIIAFLFFIDVTTRNLVVHGSQNVTDERKISRRPSMRKKCHVPHIIDESMTFWSAKNVMIIRDILEFPHEHLIKPNPSPITYDFFLSQIMPRGSHHLNSHQPWVADIINSMTFLFLRGFCPSTIIQCLIY
jgi:hypothetical protein